MVIRTFRAQFRRGVFEPLDEVDLEEGADVLVTTEEDLPVSDDPEDIALGKLIAEGLTEERVDRQAVMEVLRGGDGG